MQTHIPVFTKDSDYNSLLKGRHPMFILCANNENNICTEVPMTNCHGDFDFLTIFFLNDSIIKNNVYTLEDKNERKTNSNKMRSGRLHT